LLVIEAGYEDGIEVFVAGMGQLVYRPGIGHVNDSRIATQVGACPNWHRYSNAGGPESRAPAG
jgi:hypothetical protein